MALSPRLARRGVRDRLRILVLTGLGAVALVVPVLFVGGLPVTQPESLWLALPLVLGVADLVLVPAVGSTVRPLPYGVAEADARRISGGALLNVCQLRAGLAEAPAVFGLAASLISHSVVPYAIGFAFAVPLLAIYAYPRRAVVDGVRERLESTGERSRIWEAISGEQ